MFLQLLSLCAGGMGFGATLATNCKMKIPVAVGVGVASGAMTMLTLDWLARNPTRFKSKPASAQIVLSWLILPTMLLLILAMAMGAGGLANRVL